MVSVSPLPCFARGLVQRWGLTAKAGQHRLRERPVRWARNFDFEFRARPRGSVKLTSALPAYFLPSVRNLEGNRNSPGTALGCLGNANTDTALLACSPSFLTATSRQTIARAFRLSSPCGSWGMLGRRGVVSLLRHLSRFHLTGQVFRFLRDRQPHFT